jgi:hypothetical protein
VLVDELPGISAVWTRIDRDPALELGQQVLLSLSGRGDESGDDGVV